MSLINDALKRARQAPPQNSQSSFPVLPPVAERPASAAMWLVPAIVIVLIAAALFFIGWAMAHRSVETVVVAPATPTAPTKPAAGQTAAAPVVATDAPAAVTLPPEPPPALNLPDAPKLEGIFYSPTAPAAIVDGKTVRPGDHFLQYRVTEITRFSVTLAGANGKAIKLTIGN
jgi:hypothetical protein